MRGEGTGNRRKRGWREKETGSKALRSRG